MDCSALDFFGADDQLKIFVQSGKSLDKNCSQCIQQHSFFVFFCQE